MSVTIRKILIIAAVLLCKVGILCADTPYNSARLSLLSGYSVAFHFNSLDKIKNGINYPEALVFGIQLTSNNVADKDLQGFELRASSHNNQVNLVSDNAETLPLDFIKLHVKNKIGLEAGVSAGQQPLTTGMQPYFTYSPLTPWSDLSTSQHQLLVDIQAKDENGVDADNSITSKSSGEYRVEIEFELWPTGAGF